MIDPMPPDGETTWHFMEWAFSGFAIAVTTISIWAGNLHYTVFRHERDIKELKEAMTKVATKDDMAAIKADTSRLLDWALGKREPHV